MPGYRRGNALAEPYFNIWTVHSRAFYLDTCIGEPCNEGTDVAEATALEPLLFAGTRWHAPIHDQGGGKKSAGRISSSQALGL